MKVQVDVLGSPSLADLLVSVDIKQQGTSTALSAVLLSATLSHCFTTVTFWLRLITAPTAGIGPASA